MATLTLPVDPARDHLEGRATAPITLLEYGDFECPHCRQAHPIVEEVRQAMGDKVRYAYRHFPLRQMHPHAQLAAEAAEAAAMQGKFWEMHHALFEQAGELDEALIQQLAEKLELDTEQFRQDLDNGTYTERVQEDFSSGVRSGVNGTPTFFINGKRHDGSFDKESLLAALDQAG
ncbi:MAG: DsbA family protein [Armatimonadaceae bacterium]